MGDFTLIFLIIIFQSAINLIILIWGISKLTILENRIHRNQQDIDNMGALIRRNRAIADGRLTRFICEVASKFRALNHDSAFTYPDPSDSHLQE